MTNQPAYSMLHHTVQHTLQKTPDSCSAEFWQLCLSHVVGQVGSHEFGAQLRKFVVKRHPPRDLHFALRENGYFALNYKFYVLSLAQNNFCGKQAAKLCKRLRVNPVDGKLAYKLLKQPTAWAAGLREFASRFPKSAVSPEALQQAHNSFVAHYDELRGFAAFVAHKKLRFLLKPNNIERKDLYSELLTKALKAYYTKLPKQRDDGYIFGCVKKAIANHAINMIYRETRQKRQRIYQEGVDDNGDPKFRYREVSANQTFDNDSTAYLSAMEQPDHAASEQFEVMLLNHSVRTLCTRYRRCPRKYRMLMLLMGRKSKAFTAWLKHRQIIQQRDSNTTLQLKLPPVVYNSLVVEYLRVPQHQATDFLQMLQVSLGGEHHVAI